LYVGYPVCRIPTEAGTGVMLIPPKGDILKYTVQIEFLATNNIAEYEGLVIGLQIAKDLGIQ
jgi:ribonuclease HI